MKITHGSGKTEYGPGVNIELDGAEVATAIDAYLVAHQVYVNGPRTVTVNGELCKLGHIYVDPSGFVIQNGEKISGRGSSNAEQPAERDWGPMCECGHPLATHDGDGQPNINPKGFSSGCLCHCLCMATGNLSYNKSLDFAKEWEAAQP